MSFRGSAFRDFFGEDPFERMERMMVSASSDPFFAGAPPAPFGHHGGQVERRRGGPQRARGPVIEEVEDGHVNEGQRLAEPIVEEPVEDDYVYNHQGRQRRQQSGRQRDRRQPRGDSNALSTGFHMEMGPNMVPSLSTFGNAGMATFSYSNSSSRSFGPTQVYSSTTTSRMGPGGVRETQTTIQDGRSGREEISISRGIGERERTITRRRDATGCEETIDTLHHMTSEEASQFDQEWMQQAGRHLPSFGGAGIGAGLMLDQPRLQSGDGFAGILALI
eukprot:evm.model.scf_3289.3 EVM.evm.TU.scf_3289.3   scf_3289:6905-9573(+)